MKKQPLLFTPYQLRDVSLKNRVVVPPMHQYAAVSGHANDWHTMNIGRFAAGGPGLVFVESTKIERRGSGTIGDLGLWEDAQTAGHRRLADVIRQNGSVPGLQLGHSGRKARRTRPWEGGGPLSPEAAARDGVTDWDTWELIGPSALGSSDRSPEPRPLSTREVEDLVQKWADAAIRADQAGYEVLELHGAHGYLIHQFLSPSSNQRTDRYGGSAANRRRFVIEVVEAVRAVWPAGKPLFLRLSVEDNAGWGPDESVELAKIVGPRGVDVIDCSSGGMRGAPLPTHGAIGYGYQVPYAERIKRDSGMPTMAVGLIAHGDQAERVLELGQADLIAIGRETMHNPNWTLDAAMKLGVEDAFAKLLPISQSYWLGKRSAGITEYKPSTTRMGIQ